MNTLGAAERLKGRHVKGPEDIHLSNLSSPSSILFVGELGASKMSLNNISGQLPGLAPPATTDTPKNQPALTPPVTIDSPNNQPAFENLVNHKKSILACTQTLKFLGCNINSQSVELSFPQQNLWKIQQETSQLLTQQSVLI